MGIKPASLNVPFVSVKGMLNGSAYQEVLDNIMLSNLGGTVGGWAPSCSKITKQHCNATNDHGDMNKLGVEELD